MGTEYYLVKPGGREAFELGKGVVEWTQVLHPPANRTCGICLPTWPVLSEALRQAFPGDEQHTHWPTIVADRLIAWAARQPVMFMSDYDLEAFGAIGPVVTGSMYLDDYDANGHYKPKPGHYDDLDRGRCLHDTRAQMVLLTQKARQVGITEDEWVAYLVGLTLASLTRLPAGEMRALRHVWTMRLKIHSDVALERYITAVKIDNQKGETHESPEDGAR